MKNKTYNFNAVSGISNLILNIILILYSLSCIIPLVLLVSISLTSESAIINDGYRLIPEKFALKAYEFLLKEPEVVVRAYMVTIFVTLCGVILNLVINSMYAYAISRRDFKYRRFFAVVILITMFFSGGIPTTYYVYVIVLHLKDNLLALILSGLSGGFYTLVMNSYFKQNIPTEVVESSKIDGASEFRLFFKIVLPMSIPIFATIGLFSAIFYWNDFMNSLLYIENPKLFNLQFTMQKSLMNIEFLKTRVRSTASAATIAAKIGDLPTESVRMAMVAIGIGPIILAYPFFQKYFIKGLTIGAIK